MTTTPSRPKGTLTRTASLSRLIFIVAVVLAVQSLLQALRDSGWIFWGQVTFGVIFAVLAVLSFRSWRILKRFEAQQ